MKRIIALISILVLITMTIGCEVKKATIESELQNMNIKLDNLHLVKEFDNRALAFYRVEASENLTMGLFYKNKNGWNFMMQDDILSDASENQDVTFNAIFDDNAIGKKDKPGFYVEYGIVKNEKIEKVKLIMTGNEAEKDREAELLNISGIRIWYTVLDDRRIFNVYQGITKDGIVIFDNRD